MALGISIGDYNMKILFDKGDILVRKIKNGYRYALFCGVEYETDSEVKQNVISKASLDILRTNVKWLFSSTKELIDSMLLHESNLNPIISYFSSDIEYPLEVVKKVLLSKPIFKTFEVVKGKKTPLHYYQENNNFVVSKFYSNHIIDYLYGKDFLDNLDGYRKIGFVEDMTAIDKLYMKSILAECKTNKKSKIIPVNDLMKTFERVVNKLRKEYYKEHCSCYLRDCLQKFEEFCVNIDMSSNDFDDVDYGIYLGIDHQKQTLYVTLCNNLYIKIATIDESSVEHDRSYFYALTFGDMPIKDEIYHKVRRNFNDFIAKNSNKIFFVRSLDFDSFNVDNPVFDFTNEELMAVHFHFNQI